MAQCSLTPQEFIQSAFAPQIALLCSEDADNVCLKNNLRFVELLQPFSRPTSEASISDCSGNLFPIKNFRVYFEDMNHRPPQPTLGKKILSESVSRAAWDKETSKSVTCWNGITSLALNLQTTTPWYEEWRDIFLQIQYPSDHEFTRHYIACIIIVSAGSENPMDQLNRLSQFQHQQQHQNPTRYPKWFSPNILKYYLLIQDSDDVENSKAEQVFEQMVSSYGATNCHHLVINSRPLHISDLNTPDPWQKLVEQRGLIEGNSVRTGGGSSETSSGTGTPREDLVGLPTRVTEGEPTSSDLADTIAHPLSPVAPPPEEKNGSVFDAIPNDVPLLLNRQSLPTGAETALQQQSHGACLTQEDIDRIKSFVDKFCLQALIPHVERQIRYLNDVVTNRSRSKSLLSATRRWLGGSKSPVSSATNSVVYGQEATELQTRRLGDLCFMFGLYEQAYNAYYTAKNDFKSDQAWLYFAGAQEMAALASFMQNPGDYPRRYFEGSLHTYLNVCKIYNFAIRLTLLSSEVLKYCKEFGDAAMMFIKMTSEESDLLSALMLEQAAHCFINSKRPLPRKYAFHMTLAGHRFSKAGQRAHSLRAYGQAFQVYFSRGWILAEDHVHYTMGKQAFYLKLTQDTLEAATRLLDQRSKNDSSTQQSANVQLTYMREFLNIIDKCLSSSSTNDSVSLPIPLIKSQNTKVLVGDPIPQPDEKDWVPASHVNFLDEDFREKRWLALEYELIKAIQGPPMIFKPNFHRLTSITPNNTSPFVPIKERVALQFHLENPLLVSITLSSLKPLYMFYDENSTLIEDDSCVVCEVVSGFNMPPESEQVVSVNIYPQKLGLLVVKGIVYKISLTPDLISATDSSNKVAVEVKQEIAVRGPRLNNTLHEKNNVIYGLDERLNINVVSQMPKLSVRLQDPPGILSCGELKRVSIYLSNDGPVPLTKLFLSISQPQNVFFALEGDTESGLKENGAINRLKGNKEYDHVTRVEEIPLHSDLLEPGHSLTGYLWLHAPPSPGSFDVELLFYYESCDSSHKNRYRLVRHLSCIYLYPSISLNVKCSPSFSLLKNEDTPHKHSTNLVFHVKNKLELENNGGETELMVIGVNSSFYTLVPPKLKEVKALDANQSCQLTVKCVHTQEKKENELLMSYIPLNQIEALPMNWWNFTLRERLKLPDLTSEPLPPNPMASYDLPTPTEEEAFKGKVMDSFNLDIVATVVWKSKRGRETVIGQHSVYLDKLSDNQEKSDEGEFLDKEDLPPVRIVPAEGDAGGGTLLTSLVPSAVDQERLIKALVFYPKEVSHNFKEESLCRIRFEIEFYNCCASCLLAEADFSTRECGEDSLNVLPVGASVKKFSIDGFESKRLSVFAVVTRPGSYGIRAVQIRIRRLDSSDWVPQRCSFESRVVVRSESKSILDRIVESELASILVLPSTSHS